MLVRDRHCSLVIQDSEALLFTTFNEDEIVLDLNTLVVQSGNLRVVNRVIMALVRHGMYILLAFNSNHASLIGNVVLPIIGVVLNFVKLVEVDLPDLGVYFIFHVNLFQSSNWSEQLFNNLICERFAFITQIT